jgi:hypothetical protein
MKKRYEVLIGLTYGGRDVPAGETVDDVPKRSVAWLLDMEAIREDPADGQVAGDQAPNDETAPEEERRS